ncbi:MAG: hypothetical protein KDA96_17905 [Planctomycetaceae bacterium]|nr:hypothetical protein [Planctomycetaceae bacterium]
MNETSQTAETPNEADAVVQPWMEYWLKQQQQNTQWMESLMAGKPPDIDATDLRRKWLETMTRSIDAYMRTPTFLESMRRNSQAAAAAKVASDQAKQDFLRQSGIPHADDLSDLFHRMTSAQTVILEKLEAIEQRLETIESRLSSRDTKEKREKK